MKAYFIFAIALTVAYIIYYAVMIARDLYGLKSATPFPKCYLQEKWTFDS